LIEIKCFCEKILPDSELKNIDSNLLDQLVTRKNKKWMDDQPNFKYCLTEKCGNGALIDQNSSFWKCTKCNKKACIKHDIPWHENQTCDEYDLSKNQIKANETLIKQIAKDCPNCKSPIEKNGGCDHMTCSKCKYEFCYQCLADYSQIRTHGNKYHQKTCQFYA